MNLELMTRDKGAKRSTSLANIHKIAQAIERVESGIKGLCVAMFSYCEDCDSEKPFLLDNTKDLEVIGSKDCAIYKCKDCKGEILIEL